MQNPIRGEKPRMQHWLRKKLAYFFPRSCGKSSCLGTFVAVSRRGAWTAVGVAQDLVGPLECNQS